VLDGYADQQKRVDLLAYTKAQFSTAADIRPLDNNLASKQKAILGGKTARSSGSRSLYDSGAGALPREY
jgi:hypothetical protein